MYCIALIYVLFRSKLSAPSIEYIILEKWILCHHCLLEPKKFGIIKKALLVKLSLIGATYKQILVNIKIRDFHSGDNNFVLNCTCHYHKLPIYHCVSCTSKTFYYNAFLTASAVVHVVGCSEGTLQTRGHICQSMPNGGVTALHLSMT